MSCGDLLANSDFKRYDFFHTWKVGCVKPENFQFLEKGQNRNFDYKIVISVKNPKFII